MAAKVEVLATEVVLPAEKTPAGAVWLSNLDLAARRGYMPTVYFYRPNDGDKSAGLFSASAVKESLSRALVPFYPLAGRLGLDGASRLQIDCTGEGAVFVTARSDHYVLDDLVKEFVPCGEMRDLFVPPEPAPGSACVPLMAQVTRLRCGGVVLGTVLHHSVVDARSAAHFLLTWASICRASSSGGKTPPLLPPCFDHELLGARATRTVLYDHPEYKAAAPDDVAVHGAAVTTSSAFMTVSTQQVSALKARCEGATTFRAVVALVWRCACRARALSLDAETRLYTMVDMRARLEPPLPQSYFGNAVVRTSAAATVREVVSNPVGYGARLARAMTSQGDDYARSVVDYLEGVDAMNLPRIGMSRAHLRAISWMGMSLTDADFGWGEPVFIAPAQTYYSSSVCVMNAPGKDGAIALAVTLEPESMPDFKTMFAHELAQLLQL